MPVADPPVRADGRCAVCLSPRTAHRKAAHLYRVEAEQDPFCATTCARDFHGCPLPPARPISQAQIDAAQQAADRYNHTYRNRSYMAA